VSDGTILTINDKALATPQRVRVVMGTAGGKDDDAMAEAGEDS